MQESQRRFNGRQLTIMVVAVCAAVVLAPAGVLAASHTVVSIADGKHPSRTATVTTQGAQVVSGSVRLAGTSKVSGTVKDSPSLPGTPFSASVIGTNPITVPAGKHLVMTTISVVTVVDSGATAIDQVYYDNSNHQISIPMVDQGDYSGYEYFEDSLEVYVIVDPGSSIYLNTQVSSGTENSDFLTVSGYLV